MAVQEPPLCPGHGALCRALGATSLGAWTLGANAVVVGPAGETQWGIEGRFSDLLHQLNGRCPFHRLVGPEGA